MSNTLKSLPIPKVRCETQVRREFDDEALAGLAQSIREVGLLQPIRVRASGDGYVIIDGERRFRAAKLAGITAIDAVIEASELSQPELTQRQLIANAQREDLKPLELANALNALIEQTGWTHGQLAKKLGFSSGKVSRLLALLKLPDHVRARIQSGEISASAGYALTQADDAEQQTALADEVASGKLTRDKLTARVRHHKHNSNPSHTGHTPTRVTARLDGKRSVTLAGPGLNDVETLISWLTDLLAEARKARTQNLELSTFTRTLRDRSKALEKSQ